MRFLRKLLASAAALLVVTATRAAALVQATKVEINPQASHGEWYTKPIWLAIGVVALALIMVLISMAGRHNNTTVAK